MVAAAAIAGGRRRGENEAGRIGTHRVDHRAWAGDIAAQCPKGLGQRSLNDVDPIGQAIAVANPAAARTVHTNSVYLIDIGHGAVFVGEVGNRLDRCNVAVHRIDRFEDDQLGTLRIGGLKQLLQMLQIVVPEDFLFRPRATDALDHRRVVESSERIRQSGNSLAMVEMGRLVGNES